MSSVRFFNHVPSTKRILQPLLSLLSTRHGTSSSSSSSGVNAFTTRTHNCGQLREHDAGKEVTLCGWIQFQRMGVFATLRDAYGSTQLIVPDDKSLSSVLSDLPFESVIQAFGVVKRRPDGQENLKMETGSVEVLVRDLKVLNSCRSNLPFNVRDFEKVKESLRMKYRYLELRKKKLQENLRTRSAFVMRLREYLCSQSFVDVETPTLFRKTPAGAREFIVPTHKPAQFYSLTQSPQQFKQLLMVGGLDRYFQIARCYRDEGTKPDRQPEFTQVDIELSFVDQEGVIALIEGMLQHAWPNDKAKLRVPFPRMPYEEAMSLYGSDKPDTRFDILLHDVTKCMIKTDLDFIKRQLSGSNNGCVKAFVVKNGKKYISNQDFKNFNEIAQEFDTQGILHIKIEEGSRWSGSMAKHVSNEIQHEINTQLGVECNDVIVMSAGTEDIVLPLLGKLRLKSAEILENKGVQLRDKNMYKFVWIVDFPLFLPNSDGNLESAHHPFTAPREEDVDFIYSNPLAVRSQHYDLVLNGSEIGGGSIRIHDASLQEYILSSILKEESSHLYYLLEALGSGCPPHGGIALGLDRLVAIMCNTNSIRDVMAFPKSLDGKDLMSGAPVEIAEADYEYYHIQKADKISSENAVVTCKDSSTSENETLVPPKESRVMT